MDKPLSQEALDKLPDLIEPWFFFSLIWSVGASCDLEGRKKFSEWLRAKTDADAPLKYKFPKDGVVYDYFVDDGGIFVTGEEENADDDEKKAVKPVRNRRRLLRRLRRFSELT